MLVSRKAGSCRRCGGQLYKEHDVFGDFLACIQCGAVHADSAGTNHRSALKKPPVKAASEKLPVAIGR
ncbi:MAG: hypothetical protein V1823_01420 [Chloroflexota bacterium]